MREMKESGIEWVGDIPVGWTIKPIRAEFDEVTRKNSDGEVKNALKFTYGTIVRKENFDADEESYVADTILNYTVVTPGTIMLNGLNLNFDFVSQRIGLVKETGVITSAYSAFKPISERITSEFATYLLKAYDGCKAFHNMGGGVRKILNFSELKRHYVVYPDVNEQRRIVEFLDARCAEIETIISEIQAQIDVLEQYKRSVITETVTKGLNPDAEMKDSGIEWVGMIPAHWPVHPVYTYFGERKNKNRFGTEDNLLSLSYGRVIRKDINTSDGLLPESFNTYNIVEAGDIIIRPTDLQNDKRSLRTGLVKEHGIITSAYIDLCPIKKVDSRYFHFLLHAYDVMKVFYNMGNGVRQGLNYSEFSRLMVFEPQYEEQVAIADFLDGKVAEIDGIIDQKKEQLEVLDSYKKSLIYEYVTGKKSVPLTEPAIEAVMIDPHVILAGMVIDLLGDKLKGKTQIQKLLYLFDSHLGLNLATQYYRYKHGPYDLSLDHYLNVLVENGWFKKVPGDAEKYEKGSNHAEFCDKYKDAFAQHSRKINSLVSFVKDMKRTSQIERIATIFAVWNDLILDGNRTPTDDEIIHEILTHWTPNKAKTTEDTWKGTLAKMRKQGIIPRGQGLHTLPMPQRGVNNA